MAHLKHSKGCYSVESRRNQITSGLGGRNGYYRKALTACLFITAAVSPERKNENINYDVSEPSQIFRTQAKICSLTFALAAVVSLSSRIGTRCLNLACRKGTEVWVLLQLLMSSYKKSSVVNSHANCGKVERYPLLPLSDLLSTPL